MTQPIATLLLDADGVTQHNPNFASGMERLFGDRATLTEILRLEPPSLDGTADLRTMITSFIADKGLDVDPDAVLAVWHETHTLPGVFDLLDEVRRRGVRVYLATNQQPRRGERMIAEKGYELHTDGAFYSYQMGVAKPDPRFFRIILDALGCEPRATLFIDDVAENVETARTLGIEAVLFDSDSGTTGLRAVLLGYGLIAC